MRTAVLRSHTTIMLLLLGVACAFAAAVFLIPRRALMADWARGKTSVVRGCSVFSPGIFNHEHRFQETVPRIFEVEREGPIAMFDTPIGSVWYPLGTWTLPAVVEMNEADVYQLKSTVKPGDVVIDAGAEVGTETRSALDSGARLVVAVEPEPLNLQCLKNNLVSEIREKRVIVVPEGISDEAGNLTLHLEPGNAGAASFAWQKSDQSVKVPVTTIDVLVKRLNLPKVSLIKLHVEGSERRALLGAAETIRRYHPKLAVSLEHHLDDADVLPATARNIWSGYHVHLTSCTKTFNQIHPEVALLTP